MFQFREKERQAVNMSEVKENPVKWFWYPYIPLGRVTVLHGLPDSGKSLLAARLAAACTNQKPLGEGEMPPAGNVLYMTADDDLSDLLRPRLLQAGADLSRVYAINDMLPFTLGDDSIEQLVENFGIRLLIVDPIQEYLEYDVYGDEPEMTYPIINKLEALAKKSGCAVVLTAYSDGPGGENSKRWREDFAEKVGSVLCVKRDRQDTGVRRLLHEKCLFAQEGEEYSFSLNRNV